MQIEIRGAKGKKRPPCTTNSKYQGNTSAVLHRVQTESVFIQRLVYNTQITAATPL
jgi:hypothetical protein